MCARIQLTCLLPEYSMYQLSHFIVLECFPILQERFYNKPIYIERLEVARHDATQQFIKEIEACATSDAN